MQNPPKKKKKRHPTSKDDRKAVTRWTSTRLGNTETPLLEGTPKKKKKMLCMRQDPEERSKDPAGD